LSLRSLYNDMSDSNPDGILEYLLPRFNKKGLGFVEIVEGNGVRDVR